MYIEEEASMLHTLQPSLTLHHDPNSTGGQVSFIIFITPLSDMWLYHSSFVDLVNQRGFQGHRHAGLNQRPRNLFRSTAARRVLWRRALMVMGPTPPGTGVIAEVSSAMLLLHTTTFIFGNPERVPRS
jgi:hypothetical protein